MGKTASLSQVSTLLHNKNHLFVPSILAVSWNERLSVFFSILRIRCEADWRGVFCREGMFESFSWVFW